MLLSLGASVGHRKLDMAIEYSDGMSARSLGLTIRGSMPFVGTLSTLQRRLVTVHRSLREANTLLRLRP